MAFDPDRIDDITARRLLDLVAGENGWFQEDHSAALKLALDRPVFILQRMIDPSMGELARHNDRPFQRSLGTILQDPQTEAGDLIHIKNLARHATAGTTPGLPKDVATMLYYACIALLLRRHGDGNTSLSNAQLRNGLHWVVEQHWSPEWVVREVREVLGSLDSGQWD